MSAAAQSSVTSDLVDRPLPPSTAPSAPLDLSTRQRLHVVGVGGPGMSAIAIVLAEMGHDVSGSDIRERSVLDRCRAAGVDVIVGHRRDVVHGCAAVTASTAVPAANIELVEAEANGIAVLRRAGMLASICAQADSIAVAGTHGKTSTSSMLMVVLAAAGLRPSFVIGGDVADLGTGGQWTGGRWFVVEADESDGTHEELPLYGTILTNVDVDHLDQFGDFDGIVASFDRYLAAVAGPKVLCADDPWCALLAKRHGAVTYGTAEDATYRAVDAHAGRGSYHCRVERRLPDGTYQPLGDLGIPLRGEHMMLNALAAVAMAMEVGVDFAQAADALSRFGGVARRFDVRGTDGGATLVDDYGHVPAEIAATLRAARNGEDGWKRIVAVFQPNRYNRMAVMSPDYADAFVDADVVVLTDIYASGTTPIPGVTGKLVVNAVLDHHPDTRLVWLPDRGDLVAFLARELRDGDVCISMGCGDIATLPDEVLSARRRARGHDGNGAR